MTPSRCHNCSHPKRHHKRGDPQSRVYQGACAWGWRQTAYPDDPDDFYWYAYGEPGDECRCTGFISPPKELRRRGNVSRKRGAKNEAIALKAGPGRPDLVTAEESYEVKTVRMTKAMREHLGQSERLAGGKTPVVRLVDGERVYEVRRIA